MVFLS
jgi:hypothetical protein